MLSPVCQVWIRFSANATSNAGIWLVFGPDIWEGLYFLKKIFSRKGAKPAKANDNVDLGVFASWREKFPVPGYPGLVNGKTC